jgi:hypothetical protein
MMMSKSLAVLIASVAVAGATVVGVRRLRTPNFAATTMHVPSDHQGMADDSSSPGKGGPHQPMVGGNPNSQPHGSDPGSMDSGFHGWNGNKVRAIAGKRQDRVMNGSYTTSVVGFYSGSGTAEVKDDKVSLRANVLSNDGRSGELQASNLTVDGAYFYGVGTIMGISVEINGRLDAPRASRLIATLLVADGHGVRVVGSLPASIDAGDPSWNGDVPAETDGH